MWGMSGQPGPDILMNCLLLYHVNLEHPIQNQLAMGADAQKLIRWDAWFRIHKIEVFIFSRTHLQKLCQLRSKLLDFSLLVYHKQELLKLLLWYLLLNFGSLLVFHLHNPSVHLLSLVHLQWLLEPHATIVPVHLESEAIAFSPSTQTA